MALPSMSAVRDSSIRSHFYHLPFNLPWSQVITQYGALALPRGQGLVRAALDNRQARPLLLWSLMLVVLAAVQILYSTATGVAHAVKPAFDNILMCLPAVVLMTGYLRMHVKVSPLAGWPGCVPLYVEQTDTAFRSLREQLLALPSNLIHFETFIPPFSPMQTAPLAWGAPAF